MHRSLQPLFILAGITAFVGCTESVPVIPPVAMQFDTTALEGGFEGKSYTATLDASGGTGEGYRWAVTSGNLPGGLVLRAEGTPSTKLSGTPQGSGTFTFTIEVKDSKETAASQELTLEIAPPPEPLAITTGELPNGGTELAYSAEITAANGTGTGYTWRVSGGALPSGLSLAAQGTPSTTLSGTPPAGEFGDFDFSIEVKDSDNNRSEADYTISIVDNTVPLNFVTREIDDGEENLAYSATLEAMGGSGEYSWRIQGGELPPGLELDASGSGTTTTITGTPNMRGSFTFQVAVRDEEGESSRKTFFVEIKSPPPPIRITSTELPPAEQGTAYSTTITAINGTGTGYSWSVLNGRLPAGLTLGAMGTPDTTLSGTPTEFGNFDFTVRVTDDRGNTDDVSFTLNVAEEIIPISILGATNGTITLGNAEGGADYTASITAANGFGSYNWVVTAGALPDGLTLQVPGTPDGIISGIAQELGTFMATVTVFDNNNETASVDVVITVDPPATLPTIQSDTLPDAPICGPYAQRIMATGGSNANYQWSVVSGTLPPGFVLSPTGTPAARLSGGTGNTTGSYTFTIRVTDTFGLTDEVTYTVDIVNTPGGFRWVATAGDIEVSAKTEFYLAEVCGSAVPGPSYDVTPQAAPSGASGLTGQWSAGFSPSGNAFAYVGDFTVDNTYDVYVVPLVSGTPGTPINVSANLAFSGALSAIDLRWALDGSKLAFRADGNISGADQLYVVDLTDVTNPGPAVQVSQTMPSSATDVYTYHYHFSPDGTKIAYNADFVSSDDRLWIVDLSALPTGGAPGAPQMVATASYASADSNYNYQWTPDSRAIVFNADFDLYLRDDMYWVDVSGPTIGTPINLTSTMTTDADCGWTSIDHDYYWSISPDGTKLMALCELELDNSRLVYVADISGTVPGPMQRASEYPPTLNRYATNARWSPDSTKIAYVGDFGANDNGEELYMVDVSGTLPATPVTLSTTNASTTFEMYTGAYHSYRWSPNSQMIAWVQEDPALNGPYQLYYADLSAGAPYTAVKLHPDFTNTSDDVWNFQFSPDNSKIAALGYESSTYQLHVVDLSGSTPGPWTLAHTQPVSSSQDMDTKMTSGWPGFYTWFWTADSRSLVYTAEFATASAYEGFISDVSGAPPYVQQRFTPAGATSTQEVFDIWGQAQYARRIAQFWW